MCLGLTSKTDPTQSWAKMKSLACKLTVYNQFPTKSAFRCHLHELFWYSFHGTRKQLWMQYRTKRISSRVTLICSHRPQCNEAMDSLLVSPAMKTTNKPKQSWCLIVDTKCAQTALGNTSNLKYSRAQTVCLPNVPSRIAKTSFLTKFTSSWLIQTSIRNLKNTFKNHL